MGFLFDRNFQKSACRSNAESEKSENKDLRLLDLPRPLLLRSLKHFGAACCIALLTIAMLCMEKQWYYCIGFLFALYVAWPGFSLGGQYQEGKITEHYMVCTKAIRLTPNNFYLMFVEPGSEDSEEQYRNFTLNLPKKQRAFFSPGVVFRCFLSSDKSELLAWEPITSGM